MIPYSTITLQASPSGVTDKFTDVASVQAESMRVYNSGTVDAMISSGDIKSFPLPPKDSVILQKGEGTDEVTATTESGSTKILCTAVQSNSGGDVMSSLQLVSVLKDAMGSQKQIEATLKRLNDTKAISDAKKAEALAAQQAIADAKAVADELAAKKASLDAMAASNADYVTKKTSEFTAMQADLDNQKLSLEEAAKKHAAVMAEALANADARHASADARERTLADKERAIAKVAADLAKDRESHEIEKAKVAQQKAALELANARVEAKKKKLLDATKDEGDSDA